jgi:phosphate/sulfate permease
MADNIFDNPTLLLKYYQIQAEEYKWRLEAIWEAMKHYTWLLSILLGGWPVALFLTKDLTTIRASLHYLIISPILGLFFSMIAYFVIRRTYYFYNQVEARLLYIEKVLGLTSRKDFLDPGREKAVGEDFSVKKYIENSQSIGTFMPWNARIRALFLLGFIVFAFVAIIEIVFCLVY